MREPLSEPAIKASPAVMDVPLLQVRGLRIETGSGTEIVDEISFDAPEMNVKSVRIDAQYVRDRLSPILKNEDLSRYIL